MCYAGDWPFWHSSADAGILNAEGAKDSQRAQKMQKKIGLVFFSVLCEPFAPSAFKTESAPVFIATHPVNTPANGLNGLKNCSRKHLGVVAMDSLPTQCLGGLHVGQQVVDEHSFRRFQGVALLEQLKNGGVGFGQFHVA